MTTRRMGYFFIASLYLLIIVYHFMHNIWLMGWPKYIIWGLMAISSLGWLALSLSRFREIMAQKNVRFYIGLSIFLSALLIVLGVLNWYVVTNNKAWDLTKNKTNSLSEQSLNIIKSIDQEMVIEVWTRSVERMAEGINAEQLLKNYGLGSNGKIKYQLKDPNSYPLEAKEKRVTRDPTIIVRSQAGRESRVETFSEAKAEESITNAIIQTLKSQKKTICFLSGHKELNINDKGPQGFTTLRDALEGSAYESREVLLATMDKMPEYCEVLVIAGPQSEALESEIKVIGDFIASGGPTLALLGPEVPKPWQKLFSTFQVTMNDDLVIDPRIANLPLAVITKNYNSEVEALGNFDQPVLLRFVNTLATPRESSTYNIRPVLFSDISSFSRGGGLKGVGSSLAKRNTDLPGPHILGVLIEGKEAQPVPEKETKTKEESQKPVKVMLFGTYSFAMNGVIVNAANKDFLLSAINYVAGDKDIIGIRPRDKSTATLQLNVESLLYLQGVILLAASVFIVLGLWAFRRKSSA